MTDAAKTIVFENDDQFKDQTIERVSTNDGEHTITCDGWSLWCGKECPVVPEVGQIARLYGFGLGSTVRGLFINGVKVWYRTPDEEAEHHEITTYGADAVDWLSRWDAGRSVFTIKMGGMGPGYEQCIHVTMAEILRWMVEHKPSQDDLNDETKRRIINDQMEAVVFKVPVVERLGLSGAQWGAARNLASNFYRNGPRGVMNDERVKDRHIQVSRTFPGMAA